MERRGVEGAGVEGEMEWWTRGRRPLAVCSTTKCWIMRSDWHDPAPEPRETVLPRSPSIFSSYCLCLPPTSSPPLPSPKSHIYCGSGNIPRTGVVKPASVCTARHWLCKQWRQRPVADKHCQCYDVCARTEEILICPQRREGHSLQGIFNLI